MPLTRRVGAEFASVPSKDGIDGDDRRPRLDANLAAAVEHLNAAEGPSGVDHDTVRQALPGQTRSAGAEIDSHLVAFGGRHGCSDVGGGSGADEDARSEQVVGCIRSYCGEVERILADLAFSKGL